MLPIIPLTAFIAVTLFGAALGARHTLHMFQLNGYRHDVQRQWAQKNRRALLLFLPLAGGFFFWPKKAKKPLAYTARVKRMLVTAALLAALLAGFIALLAYLFDNVYWYYAVYLLQLVSPNLILAADWLNQPVEKAVCAHYIKEAKQKLADSPNLIKIGITGSYGKTSVKYYLQTLLRARYTVFMTPEGVNTPMGVVRAIREGLTAAHEIFLCEMGAKWVGEIKELCDLVGPRHGVLTSIGPQHLESFRTLENVISTKFELADALPEGGILFANGEDENIRKKLGGYPKVVTYAAQEGGGEYFAEDIAADGRGTTFTVVTPGGERERFTTRLIGRHNVVNLVGAVAAAHTLGVPLRDLKGQMRRITPVPHRQELIDGGDVLVIDDAYNSNPVGAKAALDTLSLFGGTKILVTPGMIELGPRQAELNGRFGAQAAAVCDYIALVGATQTRPLYDGAVAAGFPPEKLIVADSLQEAQEKVRALPCQGRKVILYENDLPDNY